MPLSIPTIVPGRPLRLFLPPFRRYRPRCDQGLTHGYGMGATVFRESNVKNSKEKYLTRKSPLAPFTISCCTDIFLNFFLFFLLFIAGVDFFFFFFYKEGGQSHCTKGRIADNSLAYYPDNTRTITSPCCTRDFSKRQCSKRCFTKSEVQKSHATDVNRVLICVFTLGKDCLDDGVFASVYVGFFFSF